MRLYTTVCFTSWPRHYITYYQEQQRPYRRCDTAHVFRMGSYGLVVVPRWHRRAEDADQAAEWALQSRDVPVGDEDSEAELRFYELHPRRT